MACLRNIIEWKIGFMFLLFFIINYQELNMYFPWFYDFCLLSAEKAGIFIGMSQFFIYTRMRINKN